MKRNVRTITPYAFSYPGVTALQYETERELALADDDGVSIHAAGTVENATDYHLALYKGSNIINWLMLTPLKDGILQIKQRFIGQDEDCKLLEDKLLDYVEKWAKERHFGRLILDACHMSQGYYEQRGFMALGKPFVHGSSVNQKMLKFL